ncbi:MAG: hypothetical protein JXM72_02920 [Deltaproteobacteria bacterium]|nr:hypothetical protein [Deltaproteobacteria bacterium]
MVKKGSSKYDDLTARCPMLGHPVPFHYCRDSVGEMPCRKILDCWHERFDVHSYLREIYSEEEIGMIVSPPKPKLLQIIELARKARGNSG